MTEIFEQREHLTQGEVAEYFRVCEGTVINWRKRGILTFVRVQGSNKPLYLNKEIQELVKQSTIPKKEVVRKTNQPEIKRKKPEISATTNKKWRI